MPHGLNIGPSRLPREIFTKVAIPADLHSRKRTAFLAWRHECVDCGDTFSSAQSFAVRRGRAFIPDSAGDMIMKYAVSFSMLFLVMTMFAADTNAIVCARGVYRAG
jgi:hypothetical protein